MIRVSVLVPVFNSAKYLRAAIESIRVQSFADFELIVLNDGSTDGSSELIRDLAAGEPRMRVIERANRGLITTRNELLSEARGEFVAWMDSDDVAEVDRLRRQIQVFEADPQLVCVGTNVRLIDPDGFPLGYEHYPESDAEIRRVQLNGGGFHFPSTMQRRSVALATGGFREPFRIGEDLDFLLRIAEQGRVSNIADELYLYRQHLMSTCTSLGAHWPVYRAAILELARERRRIGSDSLDRDERLLLPQVNDDDARRFIPAVLLQWADLALSVGDKPRAIRYVRKAISVSPLHLALWRRLARLVLLD